MKDTLRTRGTALLVLLSTLASGCGLGSAGLSPPTAAAAGVATAPIGTGLLDLGPSATFSLGGVGTDPGRQPGPGPGQGPRRSGAGFVRCIYLVERGPPRTDTPPPAPGGPLPGISI